MTIRISGQIFGLIKFPKFQPICMKLTGYICINVLQYWCKFEPDPIIRPNIRPDSAQPDTLVRDGPLTHVGSSVCRSAFRLKETYFSCFCNHHKYIFEPFNLMKKISLIALLSSISQMGQLGFNTRVPGIPDTRVTRRFSSGLLPGYLVLIPGYTRLSKNRIYKVKNSSKLIIICTNIR